MHPGKSLSVAGGFALALIVGLSGCPADGGSGNADTGPVPDGGWVADGGVQPDSGQAPDASSDAGSDAGADTGSWPALDFSQIGSPVTVAAAFKFAEGPAWDAAKGALLFSDIDADTIYKLALPSTITVFRTPSNKANGLGFDNAGLLLAAEHASRRVSRTLADGTVTTVADSWDGKKLNSPNDIVVRSDGTIYFTDPTFGLGGAPSELGYTGLYRVEPGGTMRLEAKIAGQPNGVAFAPGETVLYVAATTANQILAFDVAVDGATSNQRKFADVEAPDGFAVDRGGNLYVAGLDGGKNAVIVLDSAAKRLGAVSLGYQPTNCGFGGGDYKTLFVTARAALYRIAVPIPGY